MEQEGIDHEMRRIEWVWVHVIERIATVGLLEHVLQTDDWSAYIYMQNRLFVCLLFKLRGLFLDLHSLLAHSPPHKTLCWSLDRSVRFAVRGR